MKQFVFLLSFLLAGTFGYSQKKLSNEELLQKLLSEGLKHELEILVATWETDMLCACCDVEIERPEREWFDTKKDYETALKGYEAEVKDFKEWNGQEYEVALAECKAQEKLNEPVFEVLHTIENNFQSNDEDVGGFIAFVETKGRNFGYIDNGVQIFDWRFTEPLPMLKEPAQQQEAISNRTSNPFSSGSSQDTRQGKAFAGTTNQVLSGSFSLGGRSLSGGLPQPRCSNKNIQENGRVVINITVDPNGNVIQAEIGRGTNIESIITQECALEAAERAKFNRISGQNNQSGTIAYTYGLNTVSLSTLERDIGTTGKKTETARKLSNEELLQKLISGVGKDAVEYWVNLYESGLTDEEVEEANGFLLKRYENAAKVYRMIDSIYDYEEFENFHNFVQTKGYTDEYGWWYFANKAR